jgi:hypothetical protein
MKSDRSAHLAATFVENAWRAWHDRKHPVDALARAMVGMGAMYLAETTDRAEVAEVLRALADDLEKGALIASPARPMSN